MFFYFCLIYPKTPKGNQLNLTNEPFGIKKQLEKKPAYPIYDEDKQNGDKVEAKNGKKV